MGCIRVGAGQLLPSSKSSSNTSSMLVTSKSLSSLSVLGLVRRAEVLAGEGGSEGRMGDSWSGGGERGWGFRALGGGGVLPEVGKNTVFPDGDFSFPLEGVT